MKEYVIMTLLLLPFEDTFKVDSKLWLLDVKVPHCEVELPTTYHDGLNKHEITISKKKMQLVGNIKFRQIITEQEVKKYWLL